MQDDPTLELVPCNLCGGSEYSLRFPSTREAAPADAVGKWEAYRCTSPGYGVHPPIVQCSQCGMIYTNPRPRRDAIKHNYEIVEDPVYLRERSAREITFEKHLKSLESFSGPGDGRQLLDVGAYLGVFIEVAQQAGWDATGLEPSLWAVDYASERGLQMVRGTLEEANFSTDSFDAVTMWDVIEHLGNPLEELCHSYRILKPGGWIAVHTMDIDSVMAKIMRGRWPWLMEMHIYYFSRVTLAQMLEQAGFRVAKVRPEGRYLRLQYLTTRLRPYSDALANVVDAVGRTTGLNRVPIPVNFGDLITAYAQKPED
jgi:2-polyprenyl-3-methyl-5-hydroxy-6-metoxy-1,4-benzoquinol methylase